MEKQDPITPIITHKDRFWDKRLKMEYEIYSIEGMTHLPQDKFKVIKTAKTSDAFYPDGPQFTLSFFLQLLAKREIVKIG